MTEEIRVRIRPQNVLVLVDHETDQPTFLKLLKFLSMIWGGKYARIIIPDFSSATMPEDIRQQLGQLMPDVVICTPASERVWNKVIFSTSRSKIIIFSDKAFEEIETVGFAGLISANAVIRTEIQQHPELERDNACLLKQSGIDEYASYLAATFGFVPNNSAQEYSEALKTDYEKCDAQDYRTYLQTCMDFSDRWGWLDFANNKLSLIYNDPSPPIVVLVNSLNPMRDLALYWNLRQRFGAGFSGQIILFPENEVSTDSLVEKLADWIANAPIGSNDCQLHSYDCSKQILDTLARKLRPRLRKRNKDTKYHIDVCFQKNPTVLFCYEREESVSVSSEKNIITVPKVGTWLEQTLPLCCVWVCDLVKASITSRRPFDYCLPKRASILELLNIISGQFYNWNELVGLGYKAISVEFQNTPNTRSVKFQLPTETEIFETILAEKNIKTIKDEKNIRYNQALKLFGKLNEASTALTGISWDIIEALLNEPLSYTELREKAKLGKKKHDIDLPEMAKMILDRYHGQAKHIAEQRMHYALKSSFRKDSLDVDILEQLTTRKILKRKWKLSPCVMCEKAYWVDHIDLAQPLACPGCSNLICIPDKVDVGYELNELVRLSIDEGIRPVVLTARFLRNLSNDGFFWTPGMKLDNNGTKTDLDIVACLDGYLVAVECKSLEKASDDSTIWKEKILPQLQEPIEAVKKCGFDIFFVSILNSNIPETFKKQVKLLAGDTLKVEFLTKNDLESGYRYIQGTDENKILFRMLDLLNPDRRKNHRKRQKPKNTRTISF